MRTREFLSDLFKLAWQFVKRNGCDMSMALQLAWANKKLKAAMALKIVKFYFQKVDGTMREAYGTLNGKYIPSVNLSTGSNRKSNDTVQVFFDTEKQEWRCFKKANLKIMAL